MPPLKATAFCLALDADLPGIGDLRLEQVVHAGDAAGIGDGSDAGLVEAAAAEAAAPAAIEGQVVDRLVAQRRLRLPFAPRLLADLAGEGRGIRQERSRRFGRVLARVLVVAQSDVELELFREGDRHVAEDRPGVVALRVGEVGEARVRSREPGLLVHREHACTGVDHVAGRDESDSCGT